MYFEHKLSVKAGREDQIGCVYDLMIFAVKIAASGRLVKTSQRLNSGHLIRFFSKK